MEEKNQEPDCFKPRLQDNNHQDRVSREKAMQHIKLEDDKSRLSLCRTSSSPLKEIFNNSKKKEKKNV